MAWYSRLGKSLGGLVDVIEAPVNFAWDVGKAMVQDQEDGFWSTVWSSAMNRTGQAIGGAIGPEGFGGQVFGAIPEPVRRNLGYPILGHTGGMSIDKPGFGWDEAFGGGLFGLLDGVGREFIREPMSTLMTVASLGESDTWTEQGNKGSFGAFFDKKAWSQAHKISQTRSVGQAIAAAVMTKDILDPDELIKAQASPWFTFISGGFDAATRWFLDPDVLILKANKAYKIGRGGASAVKPLEQMMGQSIRHEGTLMRARDKANGVVRNVLGEETGKVERSVLHPGKTLDVGWEATASERRMIPSDLPFGTPGSDAMNPIIWPNARARRAIETMVGPEVTEGLDTALDLLSANVRDTSAIHRWTYDQGIKLSSKDVVRLAKDPAAGIEHLALKLADKQGINTIQYLDEAGEVADALSVGNRPFVDLLQRNLDKTVNKFGTDPYSNDALSKVDYMKSLLEARMRGGWDAALAHAKGNTDQLAADLQAARAHIVRSKEWESANGVLRRLQELPLGQRIEKIRDLGFHDSPDGEMVATWFANATTDSQRTGIMRFTLGEVAAISEIAAENPGLARDMQRMAMRRFVIREVPLTDLFVNKVDEFNMLNDPFSWKLADGSYSDEFQRMANAVERPAAEFWADMDYYVNGTQVSLPDPGKLTAVQEAALARIRENADGYTLADLRARLAAPTATPSSSTAGAVAQAVEEGAPRTKLRRATPRSGTFNAATVGEKGEAVTASHTWMIDEFGGLRFQEPKRWEVSYKDASGQSFKEIISGTSLDEIRNDIVGRKLGVAWDDVNGKLVSGQVDAATQRTIKKEMAAWAKEANANDAKVVEEYAAQAAPASRPGQAAESTRYVQDNFGTARELKPVNRKNPFAGLQEGMVRLFRGENGAVELGGRDPGGNARWHGTWFTPSLDQAKKYAREVEGLNPGPLSKPALFYVDVPASSLEAEAGVIGDRLRELQMSGDTAMRELTKNGGMEWNLKALPGNGGVADAATMAEVEKIITHRPTKATIAALEKKGLVEVGADGVIRPKMTTTYDVSPATRELQRLQQIVGEKEHLLKATFGGAIRANGMVQKIWYSKAGAPMRVVFDMTAHPFIVHDSPDVIPKLKRHLRDAGFSPQRQEEILGEFAAIKDNVNLRVPMLDAIRQEAIANMGVKYGVDLDVVAKVMENVNAAQRAGLAFAQEAKLFAGTGIDKKTGLRRNYSTMAITEANGAISHVFQPLTPAQLQNAYLMPNYRAIDKSMKRAAEVSKSFGYRTLDDFTKLPTGLAEAINNAWKPAVLLRPAWPMRVVFDEQIRMMSVMGVMERLSTMKGDLRELKLNLTRDLFPQMDKDRNALYLGVDPETGKILPPSSAAKDMKLAKPMADPRKARNRMGVGGAAAGFAVGGVPGAVIGGVAGAAFGKRNAEYANGLQALYLSGTRNLSLDGYSLMAAMGHPGDVANILREQISAGRQLDEIFKRTPAEEINRIRFDKQRWHIYTPEEAGYKEMWNNAVNHQFQNSEFTRMLWNDSIPDEEITKWLTKTPQGRHTLHQMPMDRQKNPEQWVSEARAFLDDNLLPLTEASAPLRQRLAQGMQVSFEEMTRALGPEWKGIVGDVHGMSIIQIQDTRSEIGRMGKQWVDRMMNHLGKTPTDTLSREPFFEYQYKANIERQIARIRSSMTGNTYRMSEGELRTMENQARRNALHSTRTLLYDLAEESHLGQMVGHVMPFFNAWQEVLTRYAGIAQQNPLYLARVMKAYNGLDEVGSTYTDDSGRSIQRFRIPEWAKVLVNQGIFASAIDDQGYIAFDKSSLNMLAAGMPSFGPIVTVATNAAITDRPELADSVSFMFPFGTQSGVVDAFGPTWLKRLVSAQTEDRSFNALRLRIGLDKVLTADLNGTPIDLSTPEKQAAWQQQVTNETKQLFHLRAVAGLVMPVSPQWQSPYQDFIDEYRALVREDPNNAETRFLAKHPEYFTLTQALSKLYDGVPATMEGETARNKYQDLIEAYPEFGKLIIGSEGGGVGTKFVRAIYNKQFAESISEGNPQKRREHLTLMEAVTGPEVRLGWQQWSQFNDWKLDQMQRLGVTSLSQKAAEGLRNVQQGFLANMAKQNPAWFTDFNDRDVGKWNRRMTAFEAIANTDNKDLYNRDDIRGLRDYLNLRAFIERNLAARDAAGGSADLSATKNADLASTFEAATHIIKENNLAFADLHARWLTNDPIDKNTWVTFRG